MCKHPQQRARECSRGATAPWLSPAIPPQQRASAGAARAEGAEGRAGGEPGAGSRLSPLPPARAPSTHAGASDPGSPWLARRGRVRSQDRNWVRTPPGLGLLLLSRPPSKHPRLCGRSEAALGTRSPELRAPRECLLDEKGTESGAGVGRPICPYPDEPHDPRKSDLRLHLRIHKTGMRRPGGADPEDAQSQGTKKAPNSSCMNGASLPN